MNTNNTKTRTQKPHNRQTFSEDSEKCTYVANKSLNILALLPEALIEGKKNEEKQESQKVSFDQKKPYMYNRKPEYFGSRSEKRDRKKTEGKEKKCMRKKIIYTCR